MLPGTYTNQPDKTGDSCMKERLLSNLLIAWGGAAWPRWKQSRCQGFACVLDVPLRYKEVSGACNQDTMFNTELITLALQDLPSLRNEGTGSKQSVVVL
jgi:hypothetical protein